MAMLQVVLSCLFVTFLPINASEFNKLNNFLFNGDYEFIDLTHTFDNNTIYWPNTQQFVFTKKIADTRPGGFWYAYNEFAAGEHGGTHLDAPYHFNPSGKYVGEISLDKLIVPLIIIDVTSQVNDDPNFVLHKHHLDNLLNDNFGKPCVIIFKFGWSKYFYDRSKYLGINDNGLNFPGLSAEIAEWIVKSYKNIVGVGVDVGSVDPGSSTDFQVHKIFGNAGLYNIENVDFTKKIPEYGCTALVLPMKIAAGTGAPLRLVAICPKERVTLEI